MYHKILVFCVMVIGVAAALFILDAPECERLAIARTLHLAC